MSTGPSSGMDAPQQSVQRLKLKIGSPPSQSPLDGPRIDSKEESSSPVRPSYSPVTPTLSHAPLPANDSLESWIDEPDPLPLSLDENPDAIALRATISLLQIQRQQALKDIKHLDRMKHDALKNPESFVDDLRKGKLQKSTSNDVREDVDDDDDDDDDENQVKSQPQALTEFGTLPDAQNVARCPPIEWSKYHIAGEPLNRLHELQKDYPGLTEDELARGMARGLKPQPNRIAAPYRPFVDHVEFKTSSTERNNKS